MSAPEIKFGTNEIQGVRFGMDEVERIYLCDTIVYENGYLSDCNGLVLADMFGAMLAASDSIQQTH